MNRSLLKDNAQYFEWAMRLLDPLLVAAARAFVFAACEDFGMAPLEAHALGTPVIAYAGGAATETIPGLEASGPTGVLFAEQSAAAIVDAV